MAVFPLILAILKAIPALKSLFDQFAAWYTQKEIENINKEYLNAIAKAISAKDQRDLEKAVGSPRAGEQSGLGGTEIRDSIPGVTNSVK